MLKYLLQIRKYGKLYEFEKKDLNILFVKIKGRVYYNTNSKNELKNRIKYMN